MDKIKEILLDIYGIGEKNVKIYIKDVMKIDPKLAETPTKSKVRAALKKVDNLPVLTKADLKYNPLKRIPRSILNDINDEILHALNKKMTYKMVGSYRRGVQCSGDIDIMFIGAFKKFQNLVNINSSNCKILDPYAGGESKYTTILQWKNKNYKMDGYVATKENWPTMLVFLTGNNVFNFYMRKEAKIKGMILNQYGLFKKTPSGLKKLPVKTEKDVFDHLNIKWHYPHERNK